MFRSRISWPGIQRNLLSGMTSDIPQNCAVTLPSESISDPIPANRMGIASDGKVRAYGTKKLWTLLPVDGVWRGLKPRQPGDFAYSNKLPWGGYFRDDDGPLTVTGKRLDGPAPAFVNTEEIGGFPDGDEHAAIMGGIDIPLFGCWQITGHYTDQELTFTVWVTPLPADEAPLLPVVEEQPSAWNMPPRRIHVDGAEEAKSLVYRVVPEIPHEAQVVNISGTVVLHGVIGTDGRAHELKYVSGPYCWRRPRSRRLRGGNTELAGHPEKSRRPLRLRSHLWSKEAFGQE